MSQTATIVTALKATLKQYGVTYADVGDALGLSESSVKRLFTDKNFNLSRLERICQLMNLELTDLFEAARSAERLPEQLSVEQEQQLVGDLKLLLVAFLLCSDWSYEQIIHDYSIGETEGVRLLARLDRLKIIDLLPNNRVKLRLSRSFTWRKNGPIQRFFENQVQEKFFRSSFSGALELRLVLNGMLSTGSNRTIQQRMSRLASEFEVMLDEDRKLDPASRFGTTVVMAIRPWELDVFVSYRRQSE